MICQIQLILFEYISKISCLSIGVEPSHNNAILYNLMLIWFFNINIVKSV